MSLLMREEKIREKGTEVLWYKDQKENRMTEKESETIVKKGLEYYNFTWSCVRNLVKRVDGY